MFEAAAGELRATLPRNHACDRPRGPDPSRRGPARVKNWGSAGVTVTDQEQRSRPRKGLGLPATNTHPDR